jgi:hypothetical protein
MYKYMIIDIIACKDQMENVQIIDIINLLFNSPDYIRDTE